MKSMICLNSKVTFTFLFLTIIAIIVAGVIIVPIVMQRNRPPRPRKQVITTTESVSPTPHQMIRSQYDDGYENGFLPSRRPPRFAGGGRGYPSSFGIDEVGGIGVQRGVLNHDDSDKYKLPLYGDREYPGSRDYLYIALDHTRHQNRIELPERRDVITDGEQIQVPGYPGTFTAHLYENQGPRYNPSVIY